MSKQVAGQSTTNPFMNIKDITGSNKRNVSFDNHNVLGNEIHKVRALMSTLTTQNKNKAMHSNLGFIKEKEEVRTETATKTEVDSKTEKGNKAETYLENHHTEENLSLDKTFGEEISGGK